MIDPVGGAAAGLIAICIVVVLPLAFGIHVAVRQHLLLSTLAVPTVFSFIIFVGWAASDARNPTLRWVSFPLVWWSFFPALVVSVLAALPVLAYKLYRRRRPAP